MNCFAGIVNKEEKKPIKSKEKEIHAMINQKRSAGEVTSTSTNTATRASPAVAQEAARSQSL
jgi:hypothetical protein